MIKVLSVATMREAEAQADAAGYTYDVMMQAAGRALGGYAASLIADRPQPKATILVGAGNNGGDGLVAAGAILDALPQAQVRLYLLTEREDPLFEAVSDRGMFIAYAKDDHDNRVIKHMVASADVVLDALFGIGVRLPLKGDAAKILRSARAALKERADARRRGSIIDPTIGFQVERPPRTYVIAVDCPSGLDCDTGEVDTTTLPADATVTFIAAKPGLLSPSAVNTAGKLVIAPLEMPENVPALNSAHDGVLDNEAARNLLPNRPADGHKGTFGKAMIVAGSGNYVGAASMACVAAYRSGAGLVSVATTPEIMTALSGTVSEATWLKLPTVDGSISDHAASGVINAVKGYDALLVGPGLGQHDSTRTFLAALLREHAQLPNLVIDADGLNLLAQIEGGMGLLPTGTILTPHPGEMARLCDVDTATIAVQRHHLATTKAKEWDAIVVLKGAHTLIAAPDGRVMYSPFKTDALATAGTGDILAGIAVGLLAQGMKPFEAAQLAVYAHGLSGQQAHDHVGSGRGVIATDVLMTLPEAWAAIEQG